jgi:DNA invertase Pin-like site-specific DNA recombinase
MDRVAMYLRKSRADLDAETHGEGETLEKHRKMLVELSKEKNYNIIKTYEEIASGESVDQRPEMIKLLDNVQRGLYDAVLVIDIDRLGRGRMQDQGLILDTFKESKTKIITPRKVYDLQDEFDEEYSEFEAFLARKEYKLIRRRMERGMIRALKDGYYLGARPPYGYRKIKNNRIATLEIDPEQSKIVQMIFDWYTSHDPNKRAGASNIAKRLTEMGIKSYNGVAWNAHVVLRILSNPVYIGKIIWKQRDRKKLNKPNHKSTSQFRPESEQIIVDGHHPAIISIEQFEQVQTIRNSRYHPSFSEKRPLQNPLSGLIICGFCGGKMSTYRAGKHKYTYIRCAKKGRGGGCNRVSRLEYVENRTIEGLKDWLHQYEQALQVDNAGEADDSHLEVFELTIQSLQDELKKLEKQKDKLHDFLERGIYDDETFLERSKKISSRIKDLQQQLHRVTEDYEIEKQRIASRVDTIPRVKRVLDIYSELESPQEKNILLREIIEKCVYRKTKDQRNDEFSLEIYPRI